MVDWNSDAELAIEGAAFVKLMHAFAGLYFWEFATSIDFDWAFIRGKRLFSWRLIFYWLGRYCLLLALICLVVSLDVVQHINCQSLYTFIQFAGNASVGLASINLSLRTMAAWYHSPYVVVPLVVIILGHWSLILQGMLLKAVWVPGSGCTIVDTNTRILSATFVYSMCLDAVVMILSAWKLAPRARESPFVHTLFRDGMIYFIVAFFSNLIATIFLVLNLSSVMSVIFNVPAAVASTIAASRAVRRLSKFRNVDEPVLPVTAAFSSIDLSTRDLRTQPDLVSTRQGRRSLSTTLDIHPPSDPDVQMHAFSMAETEVDLSDMKDTFRHHKIVDVQNVEVHEDGYALFFL